LRSMQLRAAGEHHERVVLLSPRLLYDLISPREQRGWHIEPEGLRGLQVYHQLVFGRRLHRKVGGLLAPEDTIHVVGCSGIIAEDVRSICDIKPPCETK
jgi:hypothetical protein